MNNMYRENTFYADQTFDQVSFERFSSQYELFSERFQRRYTGYKLDDRLLIRADSARTVNFKTLFSILKSNDLSLEKENEWMFDGEHKFLDGKES